MNKQRGHFDPDAILMWLGALACAAVALFAGPVWLVRGAFLKPGGKSK